MEIKCYQQSWVGSVRSKNEDRIEFHIAHTEEERRDKGSVVLIADGVGGQGDGDMASRIATHVALQAFHEAKAGTPAGQVLRQMFNAANLAVYDTSMANRNGGSRMATTLTASIFRNNEVCVGHIGDCRAYHIHGGRITRITDDHSYTGMQLKLGLINTNEAASSDLRSVLTRSLGQDPMIKADYYIVRVHPGDFIVHCCDGLYCCMTEQELSEIVTRWPEMACQELVDLAERRKVDDNVSVQIIHIQSIQRVTYYRGSPIYHQPESKMSGQELQVGNILDGRYEITDLISRSGMGSIFKANDRKTNRIVALKVPFMQFESDPGFFTRFKREEEIGRKLHHPFILRINPADDDDQRSRPYLVMEYLEGQTLGQLMRSVKPMPEPDALKIASRVCEALQYLHEHDIVHRDLKPDNIMICNDGTIRIMDFGIAKVEGARRLTFGGFQPAMGTPDYMAPEQVRGKRGDARTDIYSLGAILYEMLTGFPPFEGANPLVIMNSRLTGDPIAPKKRNPNISPQAEEIVLHAMARDPADRYPSAAAMKHDLDHPESVQVTGLAERLVAPSGLKSGWRRSRMMILGIALPILALIIAWVVTHVKFELK